MTEYVHQHVKVHRDTATPTSSSDVTTDRTNFAATSDAQDLAARVVWYIVGILNGLLAIRFILALLGANLSNQFASFIYSITYPFVAPFFSLFNYNFHYGVASFESYTLLAIVVYTLIGYAIARLITLNRPDLSD